MPPGGERFQELSRRLGRLRAAAEGATELARLKRDLAGAEELLLEAGGGEADGGGGGGGSGSGGSGGGSGDAELRELAREERAALRTQVGRESTGPRG